jgi:HTH-type transcriptional regulator / antitoxin HipB
MTNKDRVGELIGALVAARKERGISQMELARRTGIKQGNLSRIENRQGDPLTGNLVEIARALDLEPMLIPKQYVPAVLAIISDASEDAAEIPAYAQSWNRMGEELE